MDQPSTSKAARDTELIDLAKSPVSDSTASREIADESVFIKPQAIHKSKQRTKRNVYVANMVVQNPARGEAAAATCTDSCVEPQMKKRADEYLLVQYRPTPIRVKYKVIQEQDVVPITAISDAGPNHTDVFVREGKNLFQAWVLTRNRSKDALMEEMDKLRTQVSALIAVMYMRPFDLDKDLVTMPEGNPWILIQYSADITECAHTIMRFSDTLDGGVNPYPGYQALTKIDDNYHCVLILHKTHNYEEAVSILHNIFNSCVISTYPHLNDMSLRQEGLEKYQRPDLHKTDTNVVGNVSEGDLEIGNQVANYVGAEASAMNKLCDKIKGAEEQMSKTLKELNKINKNGS